MNQAALLSKVSLRPIRESDLSTLLKWRNDLRVFKWCRQCEPLSEEKHRAWFQCLSANDTVKMYAVQSENKELIGVCGLTSIDWINRRAEFSLYIGPQYWGNKYGEAALRRLLLVAFQIFNLHCVWGESFAGNPAIEVFKRIGLRYEGARRDFYYRDGKYIDAHLWSILKEEYAN